jgi:ferrous iron transport protein A
MLPLGLLSDGETADIASIREAGSPGERGEGHSRAEDMGLRVGKRVEMLSNGFGPVLVKVDGARIAIDRGVAMRINVRRAS